MARGKGRDMSDPHKDGGPAFPKRALVSGMYKEDGEFVPIYDDTPGMTLRDYFAAKALAGLLSANAMYGGRTDNRTALANDAYLYADAMLEARKK
jgi:hypothetical protein